MRSLFLILIFQTLKIKIILSDQCTLTSFDTGKIWHLCVGSKNDCESLQSEDVVIDNDLLNKLISSFNETLNIDSHINVTENVLKIVFYNQYGEQKKLINSNLNKSQQLLPNFNKILNENFNETYFSLHNSSLQNPNEIIVQIQKLQSVIALEIIELNKMISNKLGELNITLQVIFGIQAKNLEMIRNQSKSENQSEIRIQTMETYFSNKYDEFINMTSIQLRKCIKQFIKDIQNAINDKTHKINDMFSQLSILWTLGALKGNNSFIPLVDNFKQNLSLFFNLSEIIHLNFINKSVQFQYIISNELKTRLTRLFSYIIQFNRNYLILKQKLSYNYLFL